LGVVLWFYVFVRFFSRNETLLKKVYIVVVLLRVFMNQLNDNKSCEYNKSCNPLVGFIGGKNDVVRSRELDRDHRFTLKSCPGSYRVGCNATFSFSFRHRSKKLENSRVIREEREGNSLAIITLYGEDQTISHIPLGRFSNAVRCSELHRPNRYEREAPPPFTINPDRTITSTYMSYIALVAGDNSPRDSNALLEHVRSGKAQLNMP